MNVQDEYHIHYDGNDILPTNCSLQTQVRDSEETSVSYIPLLKAYIEDTENEISRKRHHL